MIAFMLMGALMLPILLVKKPYWVYTISLIYPVVNLPLYIIFKRELGPLNSFNESLMIVSSIILLLNGNKLTKIKYTMPLYLLAILSAWGFVIGQGNISATVRILGIKFLLIPFFLALVSQTDKDFVSKLIKTLFLVQILNCLVAIIETILGVEKLRRYGLEYGTNIRNFDAHLRAPGLALTNYQLGSYSAIVLVLAYLLYTQQVVTNKMVSRIVILLSGISSVICLLLSNYRSGIIFSLITIFFCEIISRQKFANVTVYLVLGFLSILISILYNFYLLNLNSIFERKMKWIDILLNNNWIVGSGIGFSGAASLSTYAGKEAAIVTDNQYITMLIQFGIVGIICLFIIIGYLFFKGNAISKSILVAFSSMMFSVEVLDLTQFSTLALFLIFKGLSMKEKAIP